MKKNLKKRVIFVTAFILIAVIYFYITLRGEYLQLKGIDENYISIFNKDLHIFNYIYIYSYYKEKFKEILCGRKNFNAEIS